MPRGGLARGPGNGAGLSGTGGAQARGEPGEWLLVVDEKSRDLDVKMRIACWGCGMPAPPSKECHLGKGHCHICLGDPGGTSLCRYWVAEQFLHIELRGLYPGGDPPDEWLFGYATEQWKAFWR